MKKGGMNQKINLIILILSGIGIILKIKDLLKKES
ncbi:hypothetical protein ID741_002932 [Enterococcus sp. AZ103]